MCENLVTVNFSPNSKLQSIGDYAFAGNLFQSYYEYEYDSGSTYGKRKNSVLSNKISNIDIPKSVTSIGNNAFYLCNELTTINFDPESQLETIGNYAFAGLVYEKEYDFSDHSVSRSHASNKMSTITIPKSVTSIGDYAFYLCTSLNTVNFDTEAELQSIGSYAFASVKEYNRYENPREPSDTSTETALNKIKSFTVPKNVQSLTLNILDDGTGESIDWTISQENPYIEGGKTEKYLYNKNTNTLLSCNLTQIPEAVQEKVQIIGTHAYYGVDLSSASIVLPETVTEIENNGFENCGLTSITLDAALETIGKDAFIYSSSDDYPTKITRVNYNGTIDKWLDIDFANEYANPLNYGATLTIGEVPLTDVEINKDVKKYTFYGCTGLTTITINEGSTTIGEQAFYKASPTSFVINGKVTLIGKEAFAGSNLTSITLNKELTSIDNDAFGLYYSKPKITSVTFTGTLDNWLEIDFATKYANPLNQGANLIISGQPLENAIISKNIKDYAFYGCSTLNNVTLNEGITTIGTETFYNTNISMITLPDSLTNCTAESFKKSKLSRYPYSDLFIDDIIVKSKAKYDELNKEEMSSCINNVTYQIQITFNKTNAEPRVETKLYRKDLKWNLAEGVWTLCSEEFAWDEDNWTDGEDVFIRDLADFKSKWTQGGIADDVELRHVELIGEITDEATQVSVTSQTGFFSEGTTLTVNEITDVETLKEKLGDLYFSDVYKILDISLDQKDLAKVSDAHYYLSEKIVLNYYVCLYYNYGSSSSPQWEYTIQNPIDGKYDFGNNVPTIVLLKKGTSVVEPTKMVEIKDNSGNFFAHNDEGFAENVTISAVQTNDATQMQTTLGTAYNERVKNIVTLELKQGDGAYEGETAKLWFYAGFAGQYEVYEFKNETLQALIAQNGRYTIEGNNAIIVFVEKQSSEPQQPDNHQISSNGFNAEQEGEFAEDVQLSVTKLVETEQIKEKLGAAYNTNVKSVFVVQLKQGEIDYTNENVKIWFYAGLDSRYEASILNGNELTPLTIENGKYTLNGSNAIIVFSLKESQPSVAETPSKLNLRLIITLFIIESLMLVIAIPLIVNSIIEIKRKRHKINSKTKH